MVPYMLLIIRESGHSWVFRLCDGRLRMASHTANLIMVGVLGAVANGCSMRDPPPPRGGR